MQTKVSCGLHWSGHGHACPLLCVGHALAYTQHNASTTTEGKMCMASSIFILFFQAR